jgi:alkylation response protein AidB-like acyl-CoA dehydrogenase
MDFSFNEEQQAITDLVGQILADASDPAALRALEVSEAPRFDAALWRTLAEAGVLAAFLPERFGGSGLDLVALGGVLDQLGRTKAAVPLWETLGMGVPAIAEFADEATATEWLGRVADGSAVLTAAWHEGNGTRVNPDAMVVATVAERVDDGSTAKVSGSKVPVPAGQIAHGFITIARLDGEPAVLLVDTASPGVVVTPVVTSAATPDAKIDLEGVEAKVLAVGSEAVRWAFERAVATQCAVMIGICESAVRLTAEYTKERKQFDTPIATFQAVAHRAADAFINTEGVRLTAWQALWRLAAGLPASAEVEIAKAWAADGAHKVVLAAQHLHGGVGVDRDYPLHRSYVWSKQMELYLGGATESYVRLGALIAAGAG